MSRVLTLLPIALLVVGCTGTNGDFNGDGLTDLAVGIPFRDAGIVKDAGAVQVLYGDAEAGGLSTGKAQLWQRMAPGDKTDADTLEEPAREAERYGSVLATGDFNSDGYGDLAIGVPSETVKGIKDGGTVNVLYGSAAGLQVSGSDRWFQDKQGIAGKAAPFDLFGYTLATGDFDGDLFDDLAIGVPLHNIDGFENAGAVNVLFGAVTGLSAARNQLLHQAALGIEVKAIDHRFGTVLATGDFDGDGLADLAVGVPQESAIQQKRIGAVNVIYGAAGGFGTRHQVWRQADRFVIGGDTDNSNDQFGSVLATGDFDGDGYSDLAVGTPLDDWGARNDSGTVNVLYGGPDGGLSGDGDQIWHQNIRDTGLINGDGHRYGGALAAADYNGDGFADLAIGIPGYNVGVARAGAVHVLYGTARGLGPEGGQLWRKGENGLPGPALEQENFGITLAAADFDNDGLTDLAVGLHGSPADSTPGAGGVYILHGSAAGLSAARHRFWDSAGGGLDDGSGDFYGGALVGANGGALD